METNITLTHLQKRLFDSTQHQVILQGDWVGKTFATRMFVITKMLSKPHTRSAILTKDRFVAERHLKDFSNMLDSLGIHHKILFTTNTISFNDSHIIFRELNEDTHHKLAGCEFSIVVVENIGVIKNDLVQATKCLARVGKESSLPKWIGIDYNSEAVIRNLNPNAEIIGQADARMFPDASEFTVVKMVG